MINSHFKDVMRVQATDVIGEGAIEQKNELNILGIKKLKEASVGIRKESFQVLSN